MTIRNRLTFSIPLHATLLILFLAAPPPQTLGQTDAAIERVEPGRYKSLTEPPCSYCSTQHRKGLILGEDRVLAWLRADHNGGAFPIRHFLAGRRVINDTYGLFFYDPDGGYVSAFRKDYGYEFYGWRKGVMVVRGKDGTLWSALTGIAIAGPQRGRRLERIPSLGTTWAHWMMLHPESTAYDLFDGKTYQATALPDRLSDQAQRSQGNVDTRLKPLATVLGIEFAAANKAYELDRLADRACLLDKVGDQAIAVLWYGPTRTAVAFDRTIGDRTLTLYADEISPDSAPFKDRETGSRWTLAGRAVDGPLRGTELKWVTSLQCRWYAWAAEYPETRLYDPTPAATPKEGQGELGVQADGFRGAMLAAEQATDTRLNSLKSAGVRAVALQLRRGAAARVAERKACARIQQAELDLYYWIEVARLPELADANPAWMASLQGHSEWRRLFQDPPSPGDNEVVKTYPWVPILNQEPFQQQLLRVRALLADRPEPTGVFLNDLQGGPSACGCGNHLCRWAADYGKIRTTTPLGNDAPGDFVAAVQKLLPHSQVIPVWTTECEEHDGASDGLCAGVGCFQGICWKAYTEQLMPVARRSDTLGVLLPYRAFQRDLAIYGEPAGWIAHAVKSFETMPPRHQGEPILPARLIAVLQGWDVTTEQVARQIDVAEQAGVAGYLISYQEIDQGWEPRLMRWQ